MTFAAVVATLTLHRIDTNDSESLMTWAQVHMILVVLLHMDSHQTPTDDRILNLQNHFHLIPGTIPNLRCQNATDIMNRHPIPILRKAYVEMWTHTEINRILTSPRHAHSTMIGNLRSSLQLLLCIIEAAVVLSETIHTLSGKCLVHLMSLIRKA